MLSRLTVLLKEICLIMLLLSAIGGTSTAEVRTFRKEIYQEMGVAMSKDDARIVAIARAKREALEEAGSYLETFSVVRNAALPWDPSRPDPP